MQYRFFIEYVHSVTGPQVVVLDVLAPQPEDNHIATADDRRVAAKAFLEAFGVKIVRCHTETHRRWISEIGFIAEPISDELLARLMSLRPGVQCDPPCWLIPEKRAE